MTNERREKKPLPCGTAQSYDHLRLHYPLGTWDTRVSRRFGRIRELSLLTASRLQGQDPPSLDWTYYDSLGPASDEPASEKFCSVDDFIDYMNFCMKKLSGKKVVWIGDINIDQNNISSTQYKKLDKTLKCYNLVQTIQGITRVARKGDHFSQTTIDVIFTNCYSDLPSYGNSHGGTIPPRTPPGSAWVRAGPRRTPAESAKFNFAAEQKIPPRNPPRTRRTAAEQICSAADPIGSAADWRNFRRRNALKRVRASPPQGYSESVRRGLLKNFVFAELFRD